MIKEVFVNNDGVVVDVVDAPDFEGLGSEEEIKSAKEVWMRLAGYKESFLVDTAEKPDNWTWAQWVSMMKSGAGFTSIPIGKVTSKYILNYE